MWDFLLNELGLFRPSLNSGLRRTYAWDVVQTEKIMSGFHKGSSFRDSCKLVLYGNRKLYLLLYQCLHIVLSGCWIFQVIL